MVQEGNLLCSEYSSLWNVDATPRLPDHHDRSRRGSNVGAVGWLDLASVELCRAMPHADVCQHAGAALFSMIKAVDGWHAEDNTTNVALCGNYFWQAVKSQIKAVELCGMFRFNFITTGIAALRLAALSTRSTVRSYVMSKPLSDSLPKSRHRS